MLEQNVSCIQLWTTHTLIHETQPALYTHRTFELASAWSWWSHYSLLATENLGNIFDGQQLILTSRYLMVNMASVFT